MKFKRLSEAKKYENKKQWFKDNIRDINSMITGPELETNIQADNHYAKMKVNYDLFNDILNETDFTRIFYPYGEEAGRLPVNFTNKNIIYNKIRVLEGMEVIRPFFYRLLAINPEATTRKEKKKFGMMQDWVVQQIMNIVQQEVGAQFQPQIDQIQSQGNSPESQQLLQQLQEQMAQEVQAKTPEEVNTYMERHHQDPAEVLGNQILAYNIALQHIKDLFVDGIGHAARVALEIYWVGEENKKPVIKVIHPLGFNFGKSARSNFIQDGEWATYVTYLSPVEVDMLFGDELTDKEFEDLSENCDDETLFAYSDTNIMHDNTSMHYPTQGIRVVHTEWKAQKSIGILSYEDEDGELQQTLVDGDYKVDPEIGDLSVEKLWIPTKYEGYKLGADTFVRLREVPGQHQDLENLMECKLSYKGAVYDGGVSFIDRMKNYQYFYDILMHKMEDKIAQDKGKKVIIDQDLIDDNLGTVKWMTVLDLTGLGFTNKSKEGDRGNNNVANGVKEIDFSLVSDIEKYKHWAEFIKQECGNSVGISDTLEGQIAERDAVQNVQQAISQNTTILQPFFNLHDRVKKDVLQDFIECAKYVYCKYQPETLSYTLDDLSLFIVKMDYELLENTSYGLFITDSNQTFNIMQQLQPILMSYAQSGKVQLSDMISVLQSQSLVEAQEALKASERTMQKQVEILEQQKAQLQQQTIQTQAKADQEKMTLENKYALEQIAAKGEFDLAKAQMDIQQQTILALGFDTDKDRNQNKINDAIDFAQKAQKEANEIALKVRKQILEEKKFEHNKEIDEKKIELEEKKLHQKSN